MASALTLTTCSSPVGLGKHNVSYQRPAETNTSSVSTPTFNPTSGTYGADINVAITSATSGATIYYTTDGTTPTTASTPYSGSPISIAGDGTTKTIKAIAVKSGLTDSTVATATFVINYSMVSQPQFTPIAGNYMTDQSVSITSATSGATIYYTTNGTTPTTASTVYTAPIAVGGDGTTTTIKAIAVKSGLTDSTEADATYTIAYQTAATPNIAVSGTLDTGNIYTSALTITMTSSAGATIYYTTNGTTPTTASSVAAGPITISAPFTGTQTIRAIAVGGGYLQSSEGTASYQVPMIATSRGMTSFSWFTVASDANAQYLVAGAYGNTLAVSSDGGVTWSGTGSPGNLGWQASAVNADGSYMYAADRNGSIYYSTNHGASWSQGAGSSSGGWYALSTTPTGSLVIATVNGGTIYESTNYGSSWTSLSGSSGGRAAAMSSAGDYILGPSSGNLFVSADGGTTWDDPGESGYWNGAAVSGSGQYMAALGTTPTPDILVSNDYGVNWSQAGLGVRPWYAVTISADGSHIAAAGTGFLSVSKDFGATWTDLPYPPGTNSSTAWQAIASDQYGTTLTVAANGSAGIWTIQVP